MLKVQHMAQHFKEKLFADLPTKSPPYKCPIEGCPYETKHKPDWARHYGSVHKYLDKYLKEHLETHPPHPNFLNPPPRKPAEEKKDEGKKPEKKKEDSKKPEKKPNKKAAATENKSSVAPKVEVKMEEAEPPQLPPPPPAPACSSGADSGPKFSTFLPKDHLSKILNTAMTQQSQVGKDFGVITVGSGGLADQKPDVRPAPPPAPERPSFLKSAIARLPPPVVQAAAAGVLPAPVGVPRAEIKREPKAEAVEVGSGIEPSANQLELIDQVLSNTAKHEAGPDSANPLSCFMCDEVTVFATEDELNEHINTSHFDLAGDDDLAELTNDDLEASLDFFSDAAAAAVQQTEQVQSSSSSSVAAAVSSMSTFTPPASTVPSTSGPAAQPPPLSSGSRSSSSGLTVAAKGSTGRPCEICGYEPKTKNKSRERQDHLAMKHYRPRIEEDLKAVTVNNYKCPICDYMGKDKQTIYRHYTGKHKVVEKYLADDIAAGTVVPLPQKLAVAQPVATAAATVPLPLQPPSVPTLPKNNGEQIMQVDGAFDLEDDDDGEEEEENADGISQLDGTLEDDNEDDAAAEEDADSSLNDSSNAAPAGGAPSSTGTAGRGGGVIRAVCPLCGEETKMHRTYHLATRHFKVRKNNLIRSFDS